MLFSILAIVAGANSYRTIHSFIDVHIARLREAFGVKWRKAPAYTTIHGILRQLDPASVEAAFRRHAAVLNDARNGEVQRHVAIDGKTLRRSFDNFLDRRAAHILSAFASDKALVLGHLDCDEKSNEIPAVQTLLASLALTGSVVTVDAVHCQKKHSSKPPPPAFIDGEAKARTTRLDHAIAALCDTAAPVDSTQTADKKRRCRDETRTVEVSRRAAAWPTPSGMATSVRLSASIATYSPAPPPLAYGAIAARPHYSSATSCCQPLNAAKAIREHWHIENRSHYVRDGSFAEDAAASAAILASCASALVRCQHPRFNGIHNVSDGRHRIAFGDISAILAMRVMY